MSVSDPFPRLFTVDEANALLPVLRPMMARLAKTLENLRARSRDVIQQEGLSSDSPDLMNKLQRDKSTAGIMEEVREMVQKINDYGCICKGVEEGLVDFPCFLGNEIVLLCWRSGEDSVSHWHRLEEGFAGRRPLLTSEDGDAGTSSYH